MTLASRLLAEAEAHEAKARDLREAAHRLTLADPEGPCPDPQRTSDGSSGTAPSASPSPSAPIDPDILSARVSVAVASIRDRRPAMVDTATGGFYTAGYIAALCEQRKIPVTEVNTSSWRKVCGEAWGVSFPAKSDAAKALSIALVREHYGVTCTDDEADAVLLGFWALRTRTVKT